MNESDGFRRRRSLRERPEPYARDLRGIAVVALPRLDELFFAAARRGGVALSRTSRASGGILQCMYIPLFLSRNPGLGRVSMNNSG